MNKTLNIIFPLRHFDYASVRREAERDQSAKLSVTDSARIIPPTLECWLPMFLIKESYQRESCGAGRSADSTVCDQRGDQRGMVWADDRHSLPW